MGGASAAASAGASASSSSSSPEDAASETLRQRRLPPPPLRSAELFEQLLLRHRQGQQQQQQLDAEQWARLAGMDPALARIDAWRRSVKRCGLALTVIGLLAVMAAALLLVVFMLLLLASLLRPQLAESLEPATGFIGERLLGLPMGQACLVSPSTFLPDTVALQLLRPPITDCGFCRNLTEVPRLAGVDPAAFYRDYVDTKVPVVVTDGAKDWRLGHLSFAFFRDLYASGGGIESDHCQFFPYKTEFLDLAHFFAMPDARARLEPGFPPWYVGWSNCSPRIAAILRSYYTRPYFLPPEAETLGTDWIFMGSPSYGAHMHVDDVGHPSWQAQVRGRKRWDLAPPLECSYECRPLSVTVQPGEVISLDTTVWYHGTHILQGDMSIAIGAEFD